MSTTCLHPLEVNGAYALVLIKILQELYLSSICTEVMLGVSVLIILVAAFDMLDDVGATVVTAAVCTLDFILKVICTVEVFASVCAVADVGGASGTDADVDACGFTAVTTTLEFTLLSPLGEPFLCSSAFVSSWLKCGRPLQACKPSCHV